ncbi:MAG: hypothetical protein WBE30_05995, partial [Candidatus Cybelea sp.]
MAPLTCVTESLAIALLAGCASHSDIPSAPSGVLQAALDRSVNFGLIDKKTDVGNEAMVGMVETYISAPAGSFMFPIAPAARPPLARHSRLQMLNRGTSHESNAS